MRFFSFHMNRKKLSLVAAAVLAGVFLIAILFWPRIPGDAGSGTNTIPSLPLIASWEGTNGEVVRALAVHERKIYMAAGFDGLIVLDASNLTVTGAYGTNQPVNDVVLKSFGTNFYAFLALGSYREEGGILVLNATDLSDIYPVASLLDAGLSPAALDIVLSRNSSLIVAADERSGLVSYRFDWVNAGLATNRFVSLNGKPAYDLFVQGNRAYVAAREEGVFIVDIPAGRVLSRIKPTLSLANSVFVSGRTLCVGDKMSGVTLYDISSPVNPRRISSYSTPGDAYDVWMIRNDIYVADGINGILKIRWHGGEKFSLLNQFSDGSLAYRLSVGDDETVYAACGSSGLRILDGRPAVPSGVPVTNTETNPLPAAETQTNIPPRTPPSGVPTNAPIRRSR